MSKHLKPVCVLRALQRLLILAAGLLLSCTAPKQSLVPAPQPVALVPAPVPPPAPTEFTVFYDSDPPGAIFYEIGKEKAAGVTPFWAIYPLTEMDRARGWIVIDPSRVVWPSGVTASNQGVVFDLRQGLEQKFIFIRPDKPGKDADYETGLKKLMQRYTTP